MFLATKRRSGYDETGAIAAAFADPTEHDRTRGRTGRAFVGLGRALWGVVLALWELAAALVASALLWAEKRRVDRATDGAAFGAERSALALQGALGRSWARLLGPGGALMLFGARRVAPTAEAPDDFGVLALAARTYHRGREPLFAALLGEHPRPVRAKLGAAVARDGEGRARLVWRVGHHERTLDGRSWRRVSLSEHATAEAALLAYFAEPSRLARPMPPAVDERAGDGPGRSSRSRREGNGA